MTERKRRTDPASQRSTRGVTLFVELEDRHRKKRRHEVLVVARHVTAFSPFGSAQRSKDERTIVRIFVSRILLESNVRSYTPPRRITCIQSRARYEIIVSDDVS